jgi:hypothetical protein
VDKRGIQFFARAHRPAQIEIDVGEIETGRNETWIQCRGLP